MEPIRKEKIVKKIPCLFQRNYEAGVLTKKCHPDCHWVLEGLGVAYLKYDGTSCLIKDNTLFKRYDRKLKKESYLKTKSGYVPTINDFKDKPDGWIACQEPDVVTFHWPGWMPIEKTDYWHREALQWLPDGTYELVGPKINGNPYNLPSDTIHTLIPHTKTLLNRVPRDYYGLQQYLKILYGEGIVFHHPDGRMCKIRRRDFGFDWPLS